MDENGDGFLDLGELAEVLKIIDPGNPRRNTNLWHLMDKLDTQLPYGRVQVSARLCAVSQLHNVASVYCCGRAVVLVRFSRMAA